MSIFFDTKMIDLKQKEDRELLRVILDPNNQKIVRQISDSSQISLRSLQKNIKSLSHENIRARIKEMRKAGIIRLKKPGRGRQPAKYEISPKAQELLNLF